MTYKIVVVLIKYTEYKSFIKWLNKDFRPALQITTQHEQDITKKTWQTFPFKWNYTQVRTNTANQPHKHCVSKHSFKAGMETVEVKHAH